MKEHAKKVYNKYKKDIFDEINTTGKQVIESEDHLLTDKQYDFLIVLERKLNPFYEDCEKQSKNSVLVDRISNIITVIGMGAVATSVAASAAASSSGGGRVMATAAAATAAATAVIAVKDQKDKLAIEMDAQRKAKDFLTIIPREKLDSFTLSFGFILIHRFSMIIENLKPVSVEYFAEFFVNCLASIIFNENKSFDSTENFLGYLVKNITPNNRTHRLYQIEPSSKATKQLEFELKQTAALKMDFRKTRNSVMIPLCNVLLDTLGIVEGGLICKNRAIATIKGHDAEKYLNSIAQRINTLSDAGNLDFMPVWDHDYTYLYDNFFEVILANNSKGHLLNEVINKKIPDFFATAKNLDIIIDFSHWVKNVDDSKKNAELLKNILCQMTLYFGKLNQEILGGVVAILPIIVLAEKFLKEAQAQIKVLIDNKKETIKINGVTTPVTKVSMDLNRNISAYKDLYVTLNLLIKSSEDLNEAIIEEPTNNDISIIRPQLASSIPREVESPSILKIVYRQFLLLCEAAYKLAQKPYDFFLTLNEGLLHLLGFDPNGKPGTITRTILVTAEMAALGFAANLGVGMFMAWCQCSVTTQFISGKLAIVAVAIIPATRLSAALLAYANASDQYEKRKIQAAAEINGVPGKSSGASSTLLLNQEQAREGKKSEQHSQIISNVSNSNSGTSLNQFPGPSATPNSSSSSTTAGINSQWKGKAPVKKTIANNSNQAGQSVNSSSEASSSSSSSGQNLMLKF
jgi:hypothetical protein